MKLLLIILLLAVMLSCENRHLNKPHTIIIIDTYQEVVDTNDNAVDTDWQTIGLLEDGSRTKMYGKWGNIGDTLKNMKLYIKRSEFGDIWISNNEEGNE